MKTIIATATALMLLSAAPAMAMSCCGGGKSKAGICAKGGAMAMNMKGDKRDCCCEKNGGNMSKRA